MDDSLIDETVAYIRNPDFIFRRIIDEMVLVPIHADLADMDSIYALNELGAFLWEQLAEATSPSQLKQSILDAYDAQAEDVADDLLAFLDEMIAFGAIRKA